MGPKLGAIDMMERVLLSILIGTRGIQKRRERALGGTWRMPPLWDKTRQMTNGGNGYDESVIFPGDGDIFTFMIESKSDEEFTLEWKIFGWK